MNEEKDNVQRRGAECRKGEQGDNKPAATVTMTATGSFLGWPLKFLKKYWVHPKN